MSKNLTTRVEGSVLGVDGGVKRAHNDKYRTQIMTGEWVIDGD